MIKALFISSTSACLEWQNDLSYYKDSEYEIYLNGELCFSGNTNVFSLFNLLPDTEYTLSCTQLDSPFVFRTKSERCAISVRDFGAVGDGVTDDTDYREIAVTMNDYNIDSFRYEIIGTEEIK